MPLSTCSVLAGHAHGRWSSPPKDHLCSWLLGKLSEHCSWPVHHAGQLLQMLMSYLATLAVYQVAAHMPQALHLIMQLSMMPTLTTILVQLCQ